MMDQKLFENSIRNVSEDLINTLMNEKSYKNLQDLLDSYMKENKKISNIFINIKVIETIRDICKKTLLPLQKYNFDVDKTVWKFTSGDSQKDVDFKEFIMKKKENIFTVEIFFNEIKFLKVNFSFDKKLLIYVELAKISQNKRDFISKFSFYIKNTPTLIKK